MTFKAGTDLDHYRLVEPIGEGGMGVVWKARDTSLDRDVAIEVLPESLASDEARRVAGPDVLERRDRRPGLLQPPLVPDLDSSSQGTAVRLSGRGGSTSVLRSSSSTAPTPWT